MKRSLDDPTGEIPPFVVQRLQQHRVRGLATVTGVRLVLPSGATLDFRLRAGGEPLRRDEPVYLGWGAEGPWCEPVAEARTDAAGSGSAARQIEQARAAMAAARQTRASRTIDILLS